MLLFMKRMILLTALLCSACDGGNVKETLGLNRRAPDEFRVVSRPPLSVPKEFYLYPPEEAAAHAVPQAQGEDARSVLLGGSAPALNTNYLDHYQEDAPAGTGLADTAVPEVSAGALASPAEESLLGKARANQENPEIRTLLKKENAALEEENTSVLDAIAVKPAETDLVVDAAKERARLQENAKAGKPVTHGDVPVTKPKNSVLDRLF
jgi:hypothetical protein